MSWIIRRKPEFSDGEIDLFPLRSPLNERELGFGRERIWRITEHGERHEIGQIAYRPGEGRGIFFFGHIGYHIDPPWRGKHFARKACLLIREEIARSGKSSVIITCDPDNEPSRKTCLALGCLWERDVDVDKDLQEKYEISSRKSRFIWIVQRGNECLQR